MNISWKSSPNFTEGRQGKSVSKILIHWIGAGTADSALSWLTNTASQVSAHYLISGERVWQMVKDENTAWHAGDWDVNTQSIGIEHDAIPDRPATEDTYKTSATLVRTLCDKFGVPIDKEHIIGHKSVKATQCPGTMDLDKIISLAKGLNLDPCEGIRLELEKVDKELDEMRVSRNRWRDSFDELGKRYADDLKSKIEHIEALQSTVAEQSSQISTMNQTIKDMESEKRSLREALTASDEVIVDLRASIDTTDAINDKFRDKIIKLEIQVVELNKKLKQRLKTFSRWELFKAFISRR